jgi:outer membrane lipoprotein-sorting protein
MRRTLGFLGTAVALSALFAAGMSALAQDAQRNEKFDPKVEAMFEQAVATYKSASALREKVTIKYDINSPVPILESAQPVSVELLAQKPNKLNLSYALKDQAGKITRHQIVSDGATVTTWRGDTNTFTQAKAPAKFPEVPAILDLPELDMFLRGGNPFGKLKVPARLLVVGDPVKVKSMDKGAEKETELDVVQGTVVVSDVSLKTLFRMLFNPKDRVVRGMLFQGEGIYTPTQKPMSFKIDAVYDLVELNPKVTAADFTFAPPDGAKPAVGEDQ